MPNYNRKTDDRLIVRLNSAGLSLAGVAKRAGCHHTSVTARLKALNVPPADTRRAFMEDIFAGLTVPQQEWLMNQLGASHTVKDFVRSLIIDKYLRRND